MQYLQIAIGTIYINLYTNRIYDLAINQRWNAIK